MSQSRTSAFLSAKLSAGIAPETMGPDGHVISCPPGILESLSRWEMRELCTSSAGKRRDIFRQCALAVMNSGSDVDDAVAILDTYRDFDVEVIQGPGGISLVIRNAPAGAFVDGEPIGGIREHLFAVLRDIVYTQIQPRPEDASDAGERTTDNVFRALRNARAWEAGRRAGMVVCWGGHSIVRGEYEYTKEVGYELGLRGLDVCTGCGPGAMKGPMKGAAIGHAKQRIRNGRYVGISEPGIIAAESPNPIVNHLVIMPDIEQRLEAFVRCAHGIVVFPGGAGTAEEVLYILGVLSHPDNRERTLGLVFSGPSSSEPYFRGLDEFIVETLGTSVRSRYRIIINDPTAVARAVVDSAVAVREERAVAGDSPHFNWLLRIERDFQLPFDPTHENVAGLALRRDMPVHELAASLRRAFSAIVAGNVKERGIRAIQAHGPFVMNGEPEIMGPLDRLLEGFVADGRMKLGAGVDYQPCYRIAP